MHKLARVLEGWDGYQTSLLHAAAPLTNEQLCWRPAPGRRSLGELARHISMGRITWLARMGAPGTDMVAQRIPRWHADDDGTRRVAEEASGIADGASQSGVRSSFCHRRAPTLARQARRNEIDTQSPGRLQGMKRRNVFSEASKSIDVIRTSL
jgi:hypothetical protein